MTGRNSWAAVWVAGTYYYRLFGSASVRCVPIFCYAQTGARVRPVTMAGLAGNISRVPSVLLRVLSRSPRIHYSAAAYTAVDWWPAGELHFSTVRFDIRLAISRPRAARNEIDQISYTGCFKSNLFCFSILVCMCVCVCKFRIDCFLAKKKCKKKEKNYYIDKIIVHKGFEFLCGARDVQLCTRAYL